MQRYADQLVLFSQGQGGSGAAPTPSHPAKPSNQLPKSPERQPQPPISTSTTLPVCPPQHSVEAYSDYVGKPEEMGAFDAYGGKLPTDVEPGSSTPPASASGASAGSVHKAFPSTISTISYSHAPHSSHGTHTPQPQGNSVYGTSPAAVAAAASTTSLASQTSNTSHTSSAYDDGASECGTETGTEGGETDDEPTIRPDRSCAGSECGSVWADED
jgi:hypothetical protein